MDWRVIVARVNYRMRGDRQILLPYIPFDPNLVHACAEGEPGDEAIFCGQETHSNLILLYYHNHALYTASRRLCTPDTINRPSLALFNALHVRKRSQ